MSEQTKGEERQAVSEQDWITQLDDLSITLLEPQGEGSTPEPWEKRAEAYERFLERYAAALRPLPVEGERQTSQGITGNINKDTMKLFEQQERAALEGKQTAPSDATRLRETLDKTLIDYPHDDDCASQPGRGYRECDCWQEALRAALQQPSQEEK